MWKPPPLLPPRFWETQARIKSAGAGFPSQRLCCLGGQPGLVPRVRLTRDQQVSVASEAAGSPLPCPATEKGEQAFPVLCGSSGVGHSPWGRAGRPLGPLGAEPGKGLWPQANKCPLGFSHRPATSPALRGPRFSLLSHNPGFSQRNLNSGQCLSLFSFCITPCPRPCLLLPSLNKPTRKETMGSLCLGAGPWTQKALCIFLQAEPRAPAPGTPGGPGLQQGASLAGEQTAQRPPLSSCWQLALPGSCLGKGLRPELGTGCCESLRCHSGGRTHVPTRPQEPATTGFQPGHRPCGHHALDSAAFRLAGRRSGAPGWGPGPHGARFPLPAPGWGPPLLGGRGTVDLQDPECGTPVKSVSPRTGAWSRWPTTARLTRGAAGLSFPTTSSSPVVPVND